jgi:hypothetical protein
MGKTIASSRGSVVMGAPESNVFGNQSGVVSFAAAASSMVTTNIPFDGTQNDMLGASVAMDGTLAAVGAPGHPLAQLPQTGAVFVYRNGYDLGHACAGEAECVSGYCVDDVCCKTACGGGKDDDCLGCGAMTGSAPGVCLTLGPGYACAAATECSMAQTCDGADPTCPATNNQPNGAACDAGVCEEGVCVTAMPEPAREAGPYEPPDAAGPQGPTTFVRSCTCQAAGARAGARPPEGLVLAIAAAAAGASARRRRRR